MKMRRASSGNRSDAASRQARYYADTAIDYDQMHSNDEGDAEHLVALNYISDFIRALGITSVLDIGCGTGRAYRYLSSRHPDLLIRGIDPVPELLDQAISHGVPTEAVQVGSGQSIPFPADSFDAVIEIGVLHHVDKPAMVIEEMTRVARKAVFLSDFNRFGNGPMWTRLTKFGLYRARLWPVVWRIMTRGRGYGVSAGDGVFYSYSVFDSAPALARWAERLISVPTTPSSSAAMLSPLLSNRHVLLCALRDGRPDLVSVAQQPAE